MISLSSHLSDHELKNLTIGSDDETALRNAVKRSFPGSTQVLCTRHLKENTNRYLQDEVGVDVKKRKSIVGAIFGENGLSASTDMDIFDHRLQEARSLIRQNDGTETDAKTFMTYFESRLLPAIRDFVIIPVQEKKVQPNWTNNNCESANFRLKLAAEWKQKNLSDLIELIYGIVLSQRAECERAVYGRGNFSLSERFLHNRVSFDTWNSMTEEQRSRVLKKFSADKGRRGNRVIATDGTRYVLATPTAGKKPNQVKRKRSERSRTPQARKKLYNRPAA